MTRLAFLVGLLVLVAAVPAGAATRVGGYAVTWPESRTVVPGETVRVGVRPATDSAMPRRRAVVSLVRVARSGKPLGTFGRKAVRRGTVKLKIPGSGSYALRVTVGQARRTRSLTAPVVAPPAPPPAAPVPAPPIVQPCPWGTMAAAAFAADRPAAKVGEDLKLTVTNTGQSCLNVGQGVRYARWDGTSWVDLTRSDPTILLLVVLPSGAAHTFAHRLPADLEPGRYRLKPSVSGGQGAASGLENEIFTEIDITAGP